MYGIVGLGNVGEKYQYTRHNTGFMFVDKFKDLWRGQNVVFLKPDTMMNSSGKAVKKLADYYNLSPENLYVVHDDLDLPLGEFKIQFGVGPKVHNGVTSVEEALKTKDFWRVRIGIDNRDPENRIPGEAYVLQKFSEEELKVLHKSIESAVSKLKEKL